MTRRTIADASTLIALAAIGRLDLLQRVFGKVHAVAAVLDEALQGQPGQAAIQQAVTDGWLVQLRASGHIPGLGRGESGTILAATPHDVVILDDRAARLHAAARGLRVVGLLGVLVHAVANNKLKAAEARAIVEELSRGSFRMDAALYAWAVAAIEKARTRPSKP